MPVIAIIPSLPVFPTRSLAERNTEIALIRPNGFAWGFGFFEIRNRVAVVNPI
jgi:hypothetical protein